MGKPPSSIEEGGQGVAGHVLVGAPFRHLASAEHQLSQLALSGLVVNVQVQVQLAILNAGVDATGIPLGRVGKVMDADADVGVVGFLCHGLSLSGLVGFPSLFSSIIILRFYRIARGIFKCLTPKNYGRALCPFPCFP